MLNNSYLSAEERIFNNDGLLDDDAGIEDTRQFIRYDHDIDYTSILTFIMANNPTRIYDDEDISDFHPLSLRQRNAYGYIANVTSTHRALLDEIRGVSADTSKKNRKCIFMNYPADLVAKYTEMENSLINKLSGIFDVKHIIEWKSIALNYPFFKNSKLSGSQPEAASTDDGDTRYNTNKPGWGDKMGDLHRYFAKFDVGDVYTDNWHILDAGIGENIEFRKKVVSKHTRDMTTFFDNKALLEAAVDQESNDFNSRKGTLLTSDPFFSQHGLLDYVKSSDTDKKKRGDNRNSPSMADAADDREFGIFNANFKEIKRRNKDRMTEASIEQPIGHKKRKTRVIQDEEEGDNDDNDIASKPSASSVDDDDDNVTAGGSD